MNKVALTWNAMLEHLKFKEQPKAPVKRTRKRRGRVWDLRAIAIDWYFRDYTLQQIKHKHEAKTGKELYFAVALGSKTIQDFRKEYGIKEQSNSERRRKGMEYRFIPAPGSKVGAGKTPLPPELKSYRSKYK